MVRLTIEKCDGGEKGQLCRQIIENAFYDFFSCGVKNIEAAANQRRMSLIAEWQAKDPEAPMAKYGLPIPYKTGVEEITPPFELNEPVTIELYILEGEKSALNDGLAAMDIRPLNNESLMWRLNAYVDVMDYSNGGLRWRGFLESIEEVAYHELLHACGDVPWRGKYDGILRRNMIGIASVKGLLGK